MRFAKPEELDQVITCNEHFRNFPRENISKKVERKEIIVALENEKMIGVISFEYIWTTRPYISSIFVHPEFRRQNVGSELLAYLAEFLSSRGYHYLYSSTEDNSESAKSWHLKNGFTVSGALDGLNLPNKIREIFFYKSI